MAGNAAPNYPTYFIDSTEIALREVEVPDADFAGGMNKGGSNAPGVGINTADINPKLSDWPVRSPQVLEKSQGIAGAVSGLNVEDPTFGDNALVAYVTAIGVVAPGATVAASVEGFAIVNRSDKTLAVGDRVWGTANNP